MGRAFVLALLASLNPTLLAATTVMLILSNPGRLMLGYLLGAMMTSVTLGVVIVFSLQDTSVVNDTQNAINLRSTSRWGPWPWWWPACWSRDAPTGCGGGRRRSRRRRHGGRRSSPRARHGARSRSARCC